MCAMHLYVFLSKVKSPEENGIKLSDFHRFQNIYCFHIFKNIHDRENASNL